MFSWFRKQRRRPAGRVRPVVHPALEVLEDRQAPAILTVNTLQDGNPSELLSLREAVSVVNSGSTAGLTVAQQAQVSGTLGSNDTIQFAAGLSGTINLDFGEIAMTQAVTIDGPGAGVLAVSGGHLSRIFDITSPSVGISDLTLTQGQAIGSNGGAIESIGGGALTIANCTFTGNTSDGNGGAIDSPGIILDISGSTFDHNTTNTGGGGALSIGTGTVDLINCTFTGNAANSGTGGAINSNFTADFTLFNCTVADNAAATGGGISSVPGTTLSLANTIVAGNSASSTDNDISGTINSLDYNLIQDTTGATINGATTHNLTGVDPLLGPLADNGGPTETMALISGSPAIAAGPNGSVLPGNDQTDQRGVARPAGPTDIGAFQADANYFLVTNTNDSGAGSLRQAILDSNATALLNGNPNVIQFNIPGSGVQVISPLSPLPTVTQSTNIEGYSQPGTSKNTLAVGDNAVLGIRIAGSFAGSGVDGLVLAVADTTVQGLDITGFSGDGVFDQSDSALIVGDFIGVLPDGTTAAGNGGDGVRLAGVSNTTVGGTTTGARNLISGNGGSGVEVQFGGSGNVIQGNYIGTDASGTAALGNDTTAAPFGGGVSIQDGQGVLVGGGAAGAGNLISGNNGVGVYLYGSAGSGNKVQGNKIGTDTSGTAAVGNTQTGVRIDNGASANFIGTDGDGVNDATEGNVISGNGDYGIVIGFNGSAADNNVVAGNLIGTNAAGTAALGNAIDGITIGGAANNRIGTNADGVSDALERNVISGNGEFGVSIFFAGAAGNVVAGNFIGVDSSGTSALGNLAGVFVGEGASNNTVGGTAAGAGNLISGNAFAGIELGGNGTTGNEILGNYIGLGAGGSGSLGNGDVGVVIDSGASNNTVGGTTSAARNVISGNLGSGVEITGAGSSGNLVTGDFIGTDSSGMAAVGNGEDGVLIDSGASNNTVGGTAAGAGNLISGNSADGVELQGSGTTGDIIQGNSIGTDVLGAAVLGNGDDGVLLWDGASANAIGGSGPAANLIAGNAVHAVEIDETLAPADANLVQGLSRNTDTLTYVAQSGSVTTTIDFSLGAISGPGVSNNFAGLTAITLDANDGIADLQGGSFASEVETPSAAAAGSVTFDGSFTVNYQNATEVHDTAPLTGTATYNGTTSAEAIDIVDGGLVDGFQATRLDSGASGTFSPVLFANKPAVLVNGVDGADFFTLNNPNPAAGLSDLTMQAGPTGSTFNILTVAAGLSTAAVGGAGDDSFNVNAALATGAVLAVDGGGGTNALAFDAKEQQPVGTVPGTLTVDAPSQRVTYTNITALNLNSALAVDTFYGPDTVDRGTALPGLTPEERFVQVLYLNALGRVGSHVEIDGWAALFGLPGQTQEQAQAAIAAGIEQSAEAREHLVQSWYVTFLGRQAQGGEEQAWVNQLLAGQTEEQVLSRLLGSAEFYSRAQTLGFGDTPDGNYVRALYLLLLHRQASSAEVAGWTAALAGLDRQSVALDFLQSTEQRTYLFEGYYNALLHRPDDLTGLQIWLASGLDAHTVRELFESGSEFFTNG
jgi:hypothetical protein